MKLGVLALIFVLSQLTVGRDGCAQVPSLRAERFERAELAPGSIIPLVLWPVWLHLIPTLDSDFPLFGQRSISRDQSVQWVMVSCALEEVLLAPLQVKH